MKDLARRVLRRIRRLKPHTLLVAAAMVAGAGAAAGPPFLVVILVTAVLVVAIRLHQRMLALHDAHQQSIGEVRQILEQVQRRVIAAVEKERLEAGDRHLELTDAIARADRLTPDDAETLLRAQHRETDAVIQLSRTVAPRAPMPAAEPSPSCVLGLLHLARNRKPGLTVALGAGPATIWLGYAAEQAGRLVVVEHDAARADRLRADLRAHDLTGVEVLRAPLAELTLDGRTADWYDVEALTGLTDIGLLLVDGPATEPLPPALHVLGRRLTADGLVVAAFRPGVPRQGAIDGFRVEPPPAGRWTVLSRVTTPART